jgi:anaphase-promoting complex subunit 10
MITHQKRKLSNSTSIIRQSDGVAPHLVNIQFLSKTSVSQLCFYVDYNLDESYTVKKISVRSGTTVHDLIDLTTLELNDPGVFIFLMTRLITHQAK